MENIQGFELFDINPQLVSRGKKSHRLARNDQLAVSVQVAADGGDTNMHSHPHTDSIWIVLDGEATFYAAAQGGGDRVAAKMKKIRGFC